MHRIARAIFGAWVMVAVPLASAQADQLAYVLGSNGSIDPRAVVAGHEANGEPLFACAAAYQGGVHLGKIRAAFGGCNIGYGGGEYTLPEYSVLVGSAPWRHVPDGTLPANAVKGGQEADGSPLYVCRGPFQGGVHPGKIGQRTGGCNIGYGGQEHTLHDYEVMVLQ